MASDRLQNTAELQRRPRALRYHIPSATVDSGGDSGIHLNKQGATPAVVHRMLSRERLTSFSQIALSSPKTTSSANFSWSSRKSTLQDVRRRLSLSLDISKTKLAKAKPAIEAAAAASKRAAVTTASKLNQFVVHSAKLDDCKTKSGLSRSSSSSSTQSLFLMRRLPKLKIPEVRAAVDEALNSACSTDTQQSPNFRLLELSPTSRHLKHEMNSDDHSEDVAAEFHNMLSARRRIRKGKFGAEVMRYRLARPTWDDSWSTRTLNDNWEDRELLKRLTDAVQEQKDQATRLVQRNPGAYPGLQPVTNPGCTLSIYWQNKSSYR